MLPPIETEKPTLSPTTVKYKAIISGGSSCKDDRVIEVIGEGATGHGVSDINKCLEYVSQFTDAAEMEWKQGVSCKACYSGSQTGGAGETHFLVEKILPTHLQSSTGTECCTQMNPCNPKPSADGDIIQYVWDDQPTDGTAFKDRNCSDVVKCQANQFEFKAPVFALDEHGMKRPYYNENRICHDLDLCENKLKKLPYQPVDGSAKVNQECQLPRVCCKKGDLRPECVGASSTKGQFIVSNPSQCSPGDAALLCEEKKLSQKHYETDTVCQDLTQCDNQLINVQPTLDENGVATADRTCTPLNTCTSGEYQKHAPQRAADNLPHYETDRRCEPLEKCIDKMFDGTIQPGTPGTSEAGKNGALQNNTCKAAKTSCDANYYIKTPLIKNPEGHYDNDHTNNAGCEEINSCRGQLIVAPDISTDGTATRQRNCTPVSTTCPSTNQYIKVPAGPAYTGADHYKDIQCAPLKDCTDKVMITEQPFTGRAEADHVCVDPIDCTDTQYPTSHPQYATRTDALTGETTTLPWYRNQRQCETQRTNCLDMDQTKTYWLNKVNGPPYGGVHTCKIMTECTSDQYEKHAPNFDGSIYTSDRICENFKPDDDYNCGSDEYLYLAPMELDTGTTHTLYKRDKRCEKMTVCSSSQYISNWSELKSDWPAVNRQCTDLSTHSNKPRGNGSKGCLSNEWIKDGMRDSDDQEATSFDKTGQFIADRTCEPHTTYDKTKYYITVPATDVADREAALLRVCADDQVYTVPDKYGDGLDTGYYKHNRNCDNLLAGGLQCSADDECFHGICHPGYHADDTARCNCAAEHYCPYLISTDGVDRDKKTYNCETNTVETTGTFRDTKCPQRCIKNHCNKWLSSHNTCDTTEPSERVEIDRRVKEIIDFTDQAACDTAAANRCFTTATETDGKCVMTNKEIHFVDPEFDSIIDCAAAGCTNICPTKCRTSGCTSYFNEDLPGRTANESLCGNSSRHQQGYDCRSCSTWQASSTTVNARFANSHSELYGGSGVSAFQKMTKEECIAFSARFRGKQPAKGMVNQMGWNGTTNCSDSDLSDCKNEWLETKDGGTSTHTCSCSWWGTAWQPPNSAAPRKLYQTTVRGMDNPDLPSGCLFSDYFLTFHYNDAEDDDTHTIKHFRRIGKQGTAAAGES